jgi:hypothetical protein
MRVRVPVVLPSFGLLFRVVHQDAQKSSP